MRTGRISIVRAGVDRYGGVLAVPGAVRFFVPAAVARLGVAMSRLAVLWAVQGVAGSYGQAGAATGAFALADAAVGPQVARLIDRWGQRRVVSVTASVFVSAAAALALGCLRGLPLWLLVGLAGLAGAAAPPVGALAAARWRHLVASRERRRSALALEGALNDATFLIGPVIVTTLSAAIVGWAGLVASAALVATGMVGLLTATASRPEPGGSSRGLVIDHRLGNARFATLFVANLAMGLFFGGIPVTITAFCLAYGAGALAGVLSAVAGVVSLGGGLVYGGLERGRPLPVMTAASLVVVVGSAALALVPNVPVMFAGYGLVGGCVALILVPGSVLLQHVTPSAVYTQAMTWINSASAIGIAIAATLAGYVIQGHDWRAGFLITAALTISLPLTLLVGRVTLARVDAQTPGTKDAGRHRARHQKRRAAARIRGARRRV